MTLGNNVFARHDMIVSSQPSFLLKWLEIGSVSTKSLSHGGETVKVFLGGWKCLQNTSLIVLDLLGDLGPELGAGLDEIEWRGDGKIFPHRPAASAAT